jgi:hypothetical protein
MAEVNDKVLRTGRKLHVTYVGARDSGKTKHGLHVPVVQKHRHQLFKKSKIIATKANDNTMRLK